MNNSDVRIYITGAAGVGKTALAENISKELAIPFVSSSAKTNIWPKFGFKNYNDAHIKCSGDFEVGLAYQNEVFLQRQTMLPLCRWITDRSPIDNLAYFLFQLSHHNMDDAVVNNFIERCRNAAFRATHIIYLKHNQLVLLEDDGNRVINNIHQTVVDTLIKKSLQIILPIKTRIKVIEVDAFSYGKDFLLDYIIRIMYG